MDYLEKRFIADMKSCKTESSVQNETCQVLSTCPASFTAISFFKKCEACVIEGLLFNQIVNPIFEYMNRIFMLVVIFMKKTDFDRDNSLKRKFRNENVHVRNKNKLFHLRSFKKL